MTLSTHVGLKMSGPCTAEVAVFDRFTDFLDSPADTGGAFDVVIFDTAPAGTPYAC